MAAEPRVHDALAYLDEVKRRCNPQQYVAFLDIMKSFKMRILNAAEVILAVRELLGAYHDLILGFNHFLPPGNKITEEDLQRPLRFGPCHEPPLEFEDKFGETVTEDAPAEKPPVGARPDFDNARTYVKRIKEAFADQPEVYRAFLGALHSYQANKTPVAQVRREIEELFAGNPGLIAELQSFLPPPTPSAPLIPPLPPPASSQFATVAFLERARGRLGGKPAAWKSFTMAAQSREWDSLDAYRDAIVETLLDHPDLVEQFCTLTPGEVANIFDLIGQPLP